MNLFQKLATPLFLLPLIGCEQEPLKVPEIPIAPQIEYSELVRQETTALSSQLTVQPKAKKQDNRFSHWIQPEDFYNSSIVEEKITRIKKDPEKAFNSLSKDERKRYDEFISGKNANLPYYSLSFNKETNKTDIVLRNGFCDPATYGLLENQVIIPGIVEGNLLDELTSEYHHNLPGHKVSTTNPSELDQLLIFSYERYRDHEEFNIFSTSSRIPILNIPFNIEIERENQPPIPIKFLRTTMGISPDHLRYEPEGEGDEFEKKLFDFHDTRKAARFFLDRSNPIQDRENAYNYVVDYTIDNWTSFEHENLRRFVPRGQTEIGSAFGTHRKDLTKRWRKEIRDGVKEFTETEEFSNNIYAESY